MPRLRPWEDVLLEALLRMAKGTGMLTIALSLAGGLSLNVSAAGELAGHVYVNDNTAGTNTIAAFGRRGQQPGLGAEGAA